MYWWDILKSRRPKFWHNLFQKNKSVLLTRCVPLAHNGTNGNNWTDIPYAVPSTTLLPNTFQWFSSCTLYKGADKSLARSGRKHPNVSVRMARISFGALTCSGKKNLMTARVSMLLKSRASLTCFRACLLPVRAKDLSAPRYVGDGCRRLRL